MRRLKKPLFAAFLATAKNAWAAPIAATCAAYWTQNVVNGDPLPWAIGAFGATVVYSHTTSKLSKLQVLLHALVSVFAGGVIAPWIGAAIGKQYGAHWQNDYVYAFALSAMWPWLVEIGWRKIGGEGESFLAKAFGMKRGDKPNV